MALYDRDYAKNQRIETAEELNVRGGASAFIKKTYQLFAASLLAASAGAYVGMDFVGFLHSNRWIVFGIEIALLIALIFAKKKQGLNYVLLFAFTFVSGLAITPLLSMFMQSKGGVQIITNALILTTISFGALSVFAMNTKRDFTSIGKFLFIALLVLLAACIISFFTTSPLLYLAISAGGAILFSIYVLYDTQNIIKGAYETPIEGAIALYLDFLNLFISILRLLGIFGSDE
jgi:modulator of FtsH protease